MLGFMEPHQKTVKQVYGPGNEMMRTGLSGLASPDLR